VLVSASFSMETGGVLMATFTWVCKDETTPATTPAGAALATASYVAGNDVWPHQEMAVTYAGGSVPVTAVNWTWTQPYADDRYFLNGLATRAQPIPNGLATVTGTMTSEYFDQTFYSAFRSGAFASLVCTATGRRRFRGLSSRRSRTRSRLCRSAGRPTVGGADLVDLSVPFVAKDDGVANAPWVSVYKSTDW
jgi:hypothetical protein